jgi:hypothetical protein
MQKGVWNKWCEIKEFIGLNEKIGEINKLGLGLDIFVVEFEE